MNLVSPFEEIDYERRQNVLKFADYLKQIPCIYTKIRKRFFIKKGNNDLGLMALN